jgi:hypothetical protein
VLPLQPRFVRRVSNTERIVVGLDDDGAPNAVRVVQTMRINRLGDYVFAIPAPVLAVLPGPGTQSPPGQRTNQILWQGFSPGRRVLSAEADLRVDESAPSLPVKVRVERGADGSTVIIENATGVTASSYTGDVEPAGLAQVLGRIRLAIDRNLYAEGLNVELRGRKTPVEVRVAAPLLVAGTVGEGTARKRFISVLDANHRELRIAVPGSETPKLDFRVRTAPVPDNVSMKQDATTRLAETIMLELTYARKRQYDQFISSPDPTGHSAATYVYRTAARPIAVAPVQDAGPDDHTMGWVVLGLLLAAGLPLAAVVWARS